MDKKSELLQKFLNKEVKQASTRFVLACAKHLRKEELQEHVQVFVEDFQKLFRSCALSHEEVRFVQLVLMRSQALSKGHFYRLEAFSKDFYLSEPIASVDMRLEWLYREYEDKTGLSDSYGGVSGSIRKNI